ncbi:hypothetical protein [Prevotella pallens]|uniref:hypothetical protein n=1 Tax=Prevotella pallens TaxID=60133 RepID=UPI001CAE0CD0|nr:hypothetical protein [Prevotella pallens]MBF1462367.1 hypothetical protein [Prevotella pallens]
MQGYGRDESAPTPGGMFATNFVGERNIINKPLAALRQTTSSIIAIRWNTFGKPSAVLSQTTSSRRGRFIVPTYTYSPRIRNPFEMPSRNVRNVFILCMLHIHYAKVWFLRHKSMVFGVQKPPFYIAKTPFLKYQNGVLNLEHIRQY